MMREYSDETDWVANFINLWASKPAMVMGNAVNPLDSARAFLQGVRWAHEFQEPELQAFGRFLQSCQKKLSMYTSGTDNGVWWYFALLESNGDDQRKAFQEFMRILRELAEQEGLVAGSKLEEQ